MTNQFISIQEAAQLSKKSIQTIRRAIKAKKVIIKKQKTPQGFNYLVDLESLCQTFKLSRPNENASAKNDEVKKEVKAEKKDIPSKDFKVDHDDFHSLVNAFQAMIAQHSEERQNFLRLMNTLQEKIFVLENQINLLKAPSKSWYHFWK